MAITAQDVNKLRQMTGAGMMDCKKALTEADGDFEAAVDILRKKGQKVSASRADRETTEGAVFIKLSDDSTFGVAVALGCETDFVAKNESFLALGNSIAELAFDQKFATTDELLAATIGGYTVESSIIDLCGKIGEKISIVTYEKVEGDKVISYLHSNAKLGVLLALKGVNGTDVTEVGKDVAMQIAAMKPIAIDKDDVDTTVVEREIEVGKELARNEGKPEAMLDKIAQGRLQKFYKEQTLLNQEFVKDNSKTIAQLLDGVTKGLTVSAFKRVTVA